MGFLYLKLVLAIVSCARVLTDNVDYAVEDLQAAQSSLETLLRDHEQDEAMLQLGSQVNQLLEEHEEMIKLENELIQRTLSLKSMMQIANSRQVEYLSQQLTDTVSGELESRKAKAAEKESIIEEDYSGSLSIDALYDKFSDSAEQVIKDVNDALQNWLVDRVENHVMKTRIEKAKDLIEDAALYKKPKERKVKTNTPLCISPADGAYLIQKSFSSQPQKDYLTDATIVHSYTSETYSSFDKEPLGKSAWRRFIPDDVERILPGDWEDWNVAVPSSFYRFLNMPYKAKTLPPEAILDANLHPGACWPMEGSSGFVTIRLAVPVIFEAITIKHAPALKSDKSSAPKNMNVIGYPPCKSDQVDCNSVGFNIEQPEELMQIRFELGNSAPQTFSLQGTEGGAGGSCGGAPVEDISEKPAEVIIDASGEITNEVPQCSGPPPNEEEDETGMIISAIRIEVEKNWGNRDYTCIYQIQMHGKPLQ